MNDNTATSERGPLAEPAAQPQKRLTAEDRMFEREEARRIAGRCRDAYSAYAYASWPEVALVCLKAGFSSAETETILRSKMTRWARDAWTGRTMDGAYPAKALARFIASNSMAEIPAWTRQTFTPAEIADINANDCRVTRKLAPFVR